MAENKIYYWLKLNKDFFEDDTISWIEEQENGKDYVIFYLKLCLKSLQENGLLIRYVGEKLIPYDIKALSKLTNTPADTVKVAMNLFLEIGLVTRLETGELYMNQIDEMIGSETESAKRVRKHRAKKKELEKKKSLQCNIDVIESNTEKEKETEKELELEKEQDKELDSEKEIDEDNKNNSGCDDFDNDLLSEDELIAPKESDFKKIANLYQKCGFLVNGFTPDWIKATLEQYGFEWLKNALLVAEKNDKRTKSYAEGILRNWSTKGGMDLEGKKKPQQQKSGKPNNFHNFKQRTTEYSADELEDKVRRNFENKINGM